MSAVVCNYQGERYLEACLESVLAQEGLDEVVLVDDASTDGSLELVERRFPSVRIVRLEENSGTCAARNVGLRAASHPWILAVDNDAVLLPDVLSKLRAALEARPDCVAAQTRSVLFDDETRIHYDGGAFHYVGLLSLRNFYAPLAEAEGEGVLEADALIGICALMERQPILEAGGYDEDFFYLAEDYELSLRLRILGHRLLSVEDALVRHRGGTVGLSFRGGGYPRRRAYLHSRNRCYILFQCHGLRTLIVSAPGILVYEAAFLVFALLQGHLGAHLAGKWAFLKNLGPARRKRRRLQLGRKVRDRELLVGGPLTLSPSLVESRPARAAAGVLDGLLQAWWFVARRLSG